MSVCEEHLFGADFFFYSVHSWSLTLCLRFSFTSRPGSRNVTTGRSLLLCTTVGISSFLWAFSFLKKEIIKVRKYKKNLGWMWRFNQLDRGCSSEAAISARWWNGRPTLDRNSKREKGVKRIETSVRQSNIFLVPPSGRCRSPGVGRMCVCVCLPLGDGIDV